MQNALQIIIAMFVFLMISVAAVAVSQTTRSGHHVRGEEGYANLGAPETSTGQGMAARYGASHSALPFMNEASARNDDAPFFSASSNPVFRENVKTNALVLERDADLQLDLGRRSNNGLRQLYMDYTSGEDTLDNLNAVISFKNKQIDATKRSIVERHNDTGAG